MKIGFIGLGITGKPMAKKPLKAGYKVPCYDIVAKNAEEIVAPRAGKFCGTVLY